MDELTSTIATAVSQDLTLSMALTAMGASIFLGILIALTYIFTHRDGYQQSFAVTLMMLPVILAVIILFVGSNVARAFSLAGTLSIIRFRSAPGDPEDIGYIFFSIAAGLACGVGLYFYGLLFVLVLCAFMIIIKHIWFKGGAKQRVLKITVPEDLDYQGAFDEVLKTYTDKSKLTKVKTTDLGSLFEVVYKVDMKNNANEKAFIDALRCRNGNLNIVLSLYAPEV